MALLARSAAWVLLLAQSALAFTPPALPAVFSRFTMTGLPIAPSTEVTTPGGPSHVAPLAAAGDNAQVAQPDTLRRIQDAKVYVMSDMGLNQPNLLADGFRFISPFSPVLNKQQYLSMLKALDLRSAFPDLDYRAHDFRTDKFDANRVWFSTRTVGTHKGPIVLFEEEITPTGVRMELPPESVSLVFDDEGRIVKAVGGGLVLDRSVGNSRGLGGVYGIAAALKRPVNPFTHTPPQKVINDFFGRNPKFNNNKPPVFSPLPEAVLIGLARGLLASDFGATAPGLLADNFQFIGPLVGPLNKKTFTKAFSDFNLRVAFPDLKNDAYDFRLDPYDPARVWFTVRSSGTFTGQFGSGKNVLPPNNNRYEGGPEGVSVTFNQQGQCVKLTVGVLLDPEEGKTGGLGGVFGVLYSVGTPLPPFITRPAPQHLRNWKNYIINAALRPFKGVSSSTPSKKKKQQQPEAPTVARAESKKDESPAPRPKLASAVPSLLNTAYSAPKAAAATKPAAPAPAPVSKPEPPKAAAPKPTPAPAAKETEANKAASGSPFGGLFNFGGSSKDGASPAPAAKKPETAPAPQSKAAAAAPAPQKPTPTAAPKATSSRVVAKPSSAFRPTIAAAPTPSKPAASKPQPAKAPAPAPAKPSVGGSFSSPAPVPAKKPEPVKAAAKAAPAAKSAGTFTLKPKVVINTAAQSSPAAAPKPVAVPKPAPAPTGPAFSFPAAVEADLLKRLKGDKARLQALKVETQKFVDGKSNDRTYWGLLKSTLGRDALDFVALDIVRSLPQGPQRSALFRIYQTQ